MAIQVAFTFQLLRRLWTYLSFLLDVQLGVELLSPKVTVFNFSRKCPGDFPKGPHPLTL